MVLAQVAGFILLIISLLGVFVNFYVFYKFSKKPGCFDGFQKLCIAKTIPNMIVCLIFLFWSTPLCLLDIEYDTLPRHLNATLGQIAGWGAYIFGPLVQVGLAVNRFYVLFFPMHSMKTSKIPITNIFIIIAFIISIIYTFLGLPNGCAFVFDAEILSWRPENSRCAQRLAHFILLSVLSLSVVSNTFNFVTFLKLVLYQVIGISSSEGKTRRRKRILMYMQSVIQDSFHVIDMINAVFTYSLHGALWFKFLFLSVSFLFIHALDGIVMLIFHTDIHPAFLGRIWKNAPVVVLSQKKPTIVESLSRF